MDPSTSLCPTLTDRMAPLTDTFSAGTPGPMPRRDPRMTCFGRTNKGSTALDLEERGALAQRLGIGLFAFGGAYWPLATAQSDPLWARTCFGCVNRAPG